MKNLLRSIVKVNVLSCEPKMERDSNRQMLDREGNKLWTVDVEEKVFNEKHGKEMMSINTYKTLEDLEAGEHIVELKVTNMGEGSGSFISVKSFYTITRSIDKKATIGDVFSLDGVTLPSQKKRIKANEAGSSVTQ